MSPELLTVSEEEREAINRAFPLLTKIQDTGLREQVIKTWALAWRQSSYTTLEEAPQYPERPWDTLVKHTNGVTSGALVIGQQMNEEYELQLNLDHIIAGSLLHDVDKIVFFEGTGDKAKHGQLEEYLVHGAYGAHFALQVGVCAEVVHIIMTHTSSVNEDPKSPEGIIVEHADLAKLHALRATQRKSS